MKHALPRLIAILCLAHAAAAGAVNSVVVDSKIVPGGEAGISIPIFLNNDVALRSVVVPLVIRPLTGGAFITSIAMSFGDRLPPGGPLSDYSVRNHYSPENGSCKSNTPGGFGTILYNDGASHPVGLGDLGIMMVRIRILGQDLPPGSDVSGSMILTVDVNASQGRFEIDTTCTDPANHLYFVSSANVGIVPAFTKGLIDIGAAPDNYAPIANNDLYLTTENNPLTIQPPGILANDIDPDNDPLTAELVTGVSHGNLTLNADGSFTYVPEPGFLGTDVFSYRAFDGVAYSNLVADAQIDVRVSNFGPPVAENDSYSVIAGFTLNADPPGVLGNDSDPDGDPMTAELHTAPAHGSLTLNSDGSFLYVPAPGFTGFDGFTYRAFDGHAYSEAADVQITVTPNAGRPTAVDDVYLLPESRQITVPAPGVLSNDSDPFGETMYAILDIDVSYGTLSLSPDGSFTYMAGPNFTVSDQFTYHVFAGVAFSTPATVTILPEYQTGPPAPIEISFDIKPSSCPNPLNVASEGHGDRSVLPTAILGSADFDVTQIDLTTLRLEGLACLRTSLEDVSGPPSGASPGTCDCPSLGPDGYLDLTMKFDKHGLFDAIGPVENGQEIALMIHGLLYDNTEIYGTDCVTITVIRNRKLTTSNHPNPFNSSATIAFTLPEDAHVRLRVFDLLGRLVTTLADGARPAGDHEIVWDGRTRTGEMAPSGMYFYRLEAGSESVSGKMVFVK